MAGGASVLSRARGSDTSEGRSPAGTSLAPQTSRRSGDEGRDCWWRTHSCVPRRHSCRRLWTARKLSVGRSADTARRSACATRIHHHSIGQVRRVVAPETFPKGSFPARVAASGSQSSDCRQECRHGTHTSAYGTRIHGHSIGQVRRVVPPETFPPRRVPRSELSQSRGVGTSADAARTSACATSAPRCFRRFESARHRNPRRSLPEVAALFCPLKQ